MTKVTVTPEDIKNGKLYWGAMPLPTTGKLIGLIDRGNGDLGAAIAMPDGRVYQGNAGALKATDVKVSKAVL
jgi:hypothetical protein